MRSPSAGTGRQELARATASKPKDHFFPRVHATARLDAGALFLAQCQDFEELDRRDPVLQYSCDGKIFECRPPAHYNDEKVRAGAREFIRQVDESVFLEGRGLWTTQACIRWSAIRAEYLHVSGRSAMGFRPLMRDVRPQDEPWLRLWAMALELWLGAWQATASR